MNHSESAYWVSLHSTNLSLVAGSGVPNCTLQAIYLCFKAYNLVSSSFCPLQVASDCRHVYQFLSLVDIEIVVCVWWACKHPYYYLSVFNSSLLLVTNYTTYISMIGTFLLGMCYWWFLTEWMTFEQIKDLRHFLWFTWFDTLMMWRLNLSILAPIRGMRILILYSSHEYQ